ncbi:hypothetical protein LINGRAHAP2_LOCUS10613 [Linum grandiflorum]
MADLWRPFRGIKIEELEERLILFCFYHPLDLRWVLDNRLWTYESCLTPDQVPLDKADFWLQVYDLPQSYCTLAVGKVVEDHVGGFIAIDDKHRFTKEEPFMRFRA